MWKPICCMQQTASVNVLPSAMDMHLHTFLHHSIKSVDNFISLITAIVLTLGHNVLLCKSWWHLSLLHQGCENEQCQELLFSWQHHWMVTHSFPRQFLQLHEDQSQTESRKQPGKMTVNNVLPPIDSPCWVSAWWSDHPSISQNPKPELETKDCCLL